MVARDATLPDRLCRTDGITLRVRGIDATLELCGNACIEFSGHAQDLSTLWDMLDAPCSTAILASALGQPAGPLLRSLVDAGALKPWPITRALSDLHVTTVACTGTGTGVAYFEDARLLRENAAGLGTDLPPAKLDGDLSGALVARRTVRTFSNLSMSLAQLSTLLAFGAGSPARPAFPRVPGGPPGGRTYPSGGALYPVELLVCPMLVAGLERGYYRYQVLAHRLVQVRLDAAIPYASQMLISNGVIGASVAFLLWIDFNRQSLGKYGEKAYRLALLEAGHLAQNLLLVAANLGLAGTPLCGFDDENLAREADLDYPEQSIVYTVIVGASASSEPT